MAGAFIALAINANSQSLPAEMHLSPDGRQLFTGYLPNTGLYDQTIVRSIYLTFTQPNYWTLLQNNYQTHTDLPASMVVDGITYDSVGVRFKGQTSYSQTMNSQKKSFNISLDYVFPNQDIMGYKTLNLNNCFQDESFLREVFYQHQIKKHIPTAKSCFVKLYINGANWGVYPSVQQLNKDFYQEWFLSNDGTNWRADKPPGSTGGGGPGWGDGTAALNYLGSDTNLYKQYYTLKSTSKTNPWDDLVQTTDVLENTPLVNLPATLPAKLDVDRALWFLASENLFSDDDSYIYKGKMDYYAYYELETGRITPQEYDGNSVMDPAHQTWSPFYNATNVNYPLMNRLFAVPEYRQRYLAHMRTLIAEDYDTASAFGIINTYKSLIDTMVQNDPKKLYSYAQFNSEILVLKNFINSRKSYLLSNIEINKVSPVITNTTYLTNGVAWQQPQGNQTVDVTSNATSVYGMNGMNLYYSDAIVGNFMKLPMYDDGMHNDGTSGDGTYGASIPGMAAGTWVRFYVEAVANNTEKTVKYDPPGAEHNVYTYVITPVMSSDSAVAINEVMASNNTTAADNAGEYDDWIELYNKSANPVDISGYYLTDNYLKLDKWQFPSGTVIQPNDYLIVWADEDSVQGPLHANFKLSASGEFLFLLNANQELVDTVIWGNQITDMGFARVPNGTGNFIIQLPTFSANNNTVGIQEQTVTPITSFTIYPNPAHHVVNVVSNVTNTHLEVYNIVGEKISDKLFDREISINTSDYDKGVYLLRIGSVTKKLIVN